MQPSVQQPLALVLGHHSLLSALYLCLMINRACGEEQQPSEFIRSLVWTTAVSPYKTGSDELLQCSLDVVENTGISKGEDLVL